MEWDAQLFCIRVFVYVNIQNDGLNWIMRENDGHTTYVYTQKNNAPNSIVYTYRQYGLCVREQRKEIICFTMIFPIWLSRGKNRYQL